jgi:hypothetical protein
MRSICDDAVRGPPVRVGSIWRTPALMVSLVQSRVSTGCPEDRYAVYLVQGNDVHLLCALTGRDNETCTSSRRDATQAGA